MFKPNTIIVLAYSPKENTVYKIDVTTKKAYSNYNDFRLVNSNIYGAIVVVLVGVFSRVLTDIHLNTSLQYLKILLMLASILAGFLIFSLVRKKRYGLQLDEYLQQAPQPKEIHDIDKALDKGHLSAIQTVVVTISTLFASVYMWNQFFSDGNLISYLWASIWTLIFSWFAALVKGAIFTFKLAAELNSSENRKIDED